MKDRNVKRSVHFSLRNDAAPRARAHTNTTKRCPSYKDGDWLALHSQPPSRQSPTNIISTVQPKFQQFPATSDAHIVTSTGCCSDTIDDNGGQIIPENKLSSIYVAKCLCNDLRRIVSIQHSPNRLISRLGHSFASPTVVEKQIVAIRHFHWRWSCFYMWVPKRRLVNEEIT